MALAAFESGGFVPSQVLKGIVGLAAVVATGAAVLHVYWAAGGKWKLADAIPASSEKDVAFTPGALACLAVAALLAIFTALLWLVPFGPASWLTTAALGIAFGLLILRAIGDTKQVGFSKSDRSSRFSQEDDRVYTPLVVTLAFGAGTALFLL